MGHSSRNTSGVSKSSSDWLNSTGFPGDVSIVLFKDAVAPSPLTKEVVVFTNVTANGYQGQLNARFSKVCEIFKVRGIESFKSILEFHTTR